MIILNSLDEEKDEAIRKKLEEFKMQTAIKIVKIEGPLTEKGLDKDMKALMRKAEEENPAVFDGYDLRMHGIRKDDGKTLMLYIGTYEPWE